MNSRTLHIPTIWRFTAISSFYQARRHESRCLGALVNEAKTMANTNSTKANDVLTMHMGYNAITDSITTLWQCPARHLLRPNLITHTKVVSLAESPVPVICFSFDRKPRRARLSSVKAGKTQQTPTWVTLDRTQSGPMLISTCSGTSTLGCINNFVRTTEVTPARLKLRLAIAYMQVPTHIWQCLAKDDSRRRYSCADIGGQVYCRYDG